MKPPVPIGGHDSPSKAESADARNIPRHGGAEGPTDEPPSFNDTARPDFGRAGELPELDSRHRRTDSPAIPIYIGINPDTSGLALPLIYQELRANPICRFHLLDPLLTCHGFGSAAMRFRPDEFPWAVLYGVLGFGIGRVVVFFHTAIKVISRADIETTLWILQNIGPVLVLFTRQTPRSEPSS